MFRKLIALTAASLLCILVSACASFESCAPLYAKDIELSKQKGDVVTSVFGQFVSFPLPEGFAQVFEGLENNTFILQAIPKGNAVFWTHTITFTGIKRSTSKYPNATPAQLVNLMANSFKRKCPDSYATQGLGPVKLDGHDGFAAVVSCGVISFGGAPYSESILVILVKGESNYYSVQWTEKGEASKTPLKLERAKWEDRFKQLTPIKLYPIIPGEKSSDPACVNPGASVPTNPSRKNNQNSKVAWISAALSRATRASQQS